jgi:hypothetical protein
MSDPPDCTPHPVESSSIPATHSENHSAQPILALPAGGYPDISDSETSKPEHPAMCHKLYTPYSVVASLNKPHPACETPKINAFFILYLADL